ncbi:MAG: nucleotidyltransferase family protein [Desulfovibrio sp.]|jgi:CTP:molybdopterin cytidylyltransferase MocA|nr:nucleotidyltransferase family protein [Desulfovibrio sp.]
MKTGALILAAGRAARMGRIKALLPLPLPGGGEKSPVPECSALERLVRLYRAAGVRDLLLVSGFHAQEVEGAANALDLPVIRNPHPEKGMFSSVCAGLEAAPPEWTALFIHPVDVPLVREETLRLLLDAASADPRAVLTPRHGGCSGHPPLVPASCIASILASRGGGSLHSALAALPQRSLEIADPFILEDMDSPQDYERLRVLALMRKLD